MNYATGLFFVILRRRFKIICRILRPHSNKKSNSRFVYSLLTCIHTFPMEW